MDSNLKRSCETLTTNLPLSLLFKIVLVIAIYVSVYSPLFVYRQVGYNQEDVTLVYKPQVPLTFNVLVSNSVSKPPAEFVRMNTVSSASFNHLKKELFHLQEEIPYVWKVSKLQLRKKRGELVQTGSSPVNLTEFLSKTFMRCRTGASWSETCDCCRENMFKLTPCCEVSWYKCFRILMIILGAMLMVCPWLLRIWFYYRFEEDDRGRLHHKFDLLNAKQTYHGSLVIYFTPVHYFFITIYCIIPATLNVYISLPNLLKQRLRSVVQECFDNMSKTKTTGAVSTFFAHILWPLTEFGIVGALVIPLWLLVLPLELALLFYRIVPLCNVFCRLAVNCGAIAVKTVCPKARNCHRSDSVIEHFKQWIKNATKDMRVQEHEDLSRKQNAIITIMLALTCLSLLSATVLLFECVTFYLECLLYVVIGFILNGVIFFKFLVLFGYFVWYAYDCFRDVTKQFKSFSDALIVAVQDYMQLEMESQTYVDIPSVGAFTPFNSTSDNDAHVSFASSLCSDKSGQLQVADDGDLKWTLTHPIFFRDGESAIYLSKYFILQAANSKHVGKCSVIKACLRAFGHLLCSTLFLLVVLLFVLAIDDNKATLSFALTVFAFICGALPGLATRYCMVSKSELSSLFGPFKFNENIPAILQDYSESCSIGDIEVKEIKAKEEHPVMDTHDVQKAACDMSFDNGCYLEHQISDFTKVNPAHNTDHVDDELTRTVLLGTNFYIPNMILT